MMLAAGFRLLTNPWPSSYYVDYALGLDARFSTPAPRSVACVVTAMTTFSRHERYQRKLSQDISDALTYLHGAGLIPWNGLLTKRARWSNDARRQEIPELLGVRLFLE